MSASVDRRSRTRVVITVIAQSLVSATAILLLYYVVPTSASIGGRWTCAVVFIGVALFQLHGVVKDPQPVARAFSEPLTKSGSLYFTVTVFSRSDSATSRRSRTRRGLSPPCR